METEGWLDLDISEANLDLPGDIEMEDATIPEMEKDEPTPRKASLRRVLAKRTRNISANSRSMAAKCWTRI
jgi:hypothetical protein